MKQVSVIIPTYNNAQYIDDCINSIIHQTYKNIEIIIINDGSTDDTEKKILEWRLKDSRIKYYSNKNHGVSYSRNYGIKKSNGEYLVFIDADDIISLDFIESLLVMLEKQEADCCVCGIKGFYNMQEIKDIKSIEKSKCEETYRGVEVKNTLLGVCGGFLANKIYKTSIIKKNNLKLDEKIAISEDLLFNLQYFNYCQKIIYNKSVKYFYRQYHSSSYNNLENSNWFSVLDMYNKILCSPKLLKNLDKEKVVNRLCFLLS